MSNSSFLLLPLPRQQYKYRTLIFTGNLAEYQGIDLMLRAFAEARLSMRDARLMIVSESSFGPYEKLAAELGVRDAIDLIPAPPFAQLPQLLVHPPSRLPPRLPRSNHS